MLGKIAGRAFMNIAGLLGRFGPTKSAINKLMIKLVVNQARTRPHPWSTVHDYTSWTALTDKTWTARHLPVHDAGVLPPVEQVADLFRIPEGRGSRLSQRSTLLFPAFAQYLTDGFIRTVIPSDGGDNTVRLRNTSNHEIDLCTLYGRTAEQTRALRLLSADPGRRGRLKSQHIDDEEFPPFLYDGDDVKPEFTMLDRPLGLSKLREENRAELFAVGGDRVNSVPQVGMINTLLLREHNRLAAEIERTNPGWDDERVFETARNCLIVIFIQIVVEEYINHISPAPFDFVADPSVAWDATWNRPNWITMEFGLLYRWHSLVPERIAWGDGPVDIDTTFLNNRPLIAGGLGPSFARMSAQPAAHLGMRNTPDSLLPAEHAAIAQGRLARLAPFTDYRAYMGQGDVGDFSDISSDPGVVAALEDLYGDPRKVEYYVGLFAEDRSDSSPLPSLMRGMVGLDAFSQALTNPLLSEHVFSQKEVAFSAVGWEAIQSTTSLRDLLERNVGDPAAIGRVSMWLED